VTGPEHHDFTVLVPLSDFNWDGNDLSISTLFTVRRLAVPPDLSWCESFLSQCDKNELSSVSHWLSFEQSQSDYLNPKEKLNLFLLTLWLVVPTKTQAKFRFELPTQAGQRISSRLLDRFQWIGPQVKGRVEPKHLQEMTRYVDAMIAIYTARKRLRNSLVLTLRGCKTIDWQVAVVCFSAAAEGLLTYERGPGLTRRLAKSYACLVETTKQRRDRAFKTFSDSYDVRSDIMHGRATHRRSPKKNLKDAARLSDMLRRLWKAILSQPTVLNALEKNDVDRKRWFGNLERGYAPPP
jgi:hypothetical protein